jgi:hypothetical protein
LLVRPIGCPETSVTNCHSMLRNIPEDGISYYRTCPCIVCRVALCIR